MVQTPYQMYPNINLYFLTGNRPSSAPCPGNTNNQSQPLLAPQPGDQPNNMGGAMQGFPPSFFPIYAIPCAMICPFPPGGGFPQMPGNFQQPQQQQSFSQVPSQMGPSFEHLTCSSTCPGYIPREVPPLDNLCQRYTCPVFLPLSTAPSGDTVVSKPTGSGEVQAEATPEELSVSLNISMDETPTIPDTQSKSHI